MPKTVKVIDLFAGLGGIRLGFTQAFESQGYKVDCVLTSEIKPHAVATYTHNFPGETLRGDVTQIDEKEIPDFDFLLAGFPCQPFSYAGSRKGFSDTRGTLFFDIERILKAKQPYGFILENVEGLVKHDLANKHDTIGRTLTTILSHLEALGYHVEYRVFNSHDFGLPQNRKRIYIVGTKRGHVSLAGFDHSTATVESVLEQGEPLIDSFFTRKILSHYTPRELYGKQVKDKRGGANNIHSWDIGLKGEVSPEQKILLAQLFTERRKKHWAQSKGIVWMDGMPLTVEEIRTFNDAENVEAMLTDLVGKGYLVYEHPKNLLPVEQEDGSTRLERITDESIPEGYNIVTGKLSFEFACILDPQGSTPALIASDLSKIGVVDGDGIRRLTVREGLRMFGFPETYTIPVSTAKAYDLLGNSVTVPVVAAVAARVAANYKENTAA